MVEWTESSPDYLRHAFGFRENGTLLEAVSNRLPVSKLTLDRPLELAFCVCNTFTKPSPQLLCKLCDTVFHPTCVGKTGGDRTRSWTCGFCEGYQSLLSSVGWSVKRKIKKRGRKAKEAPKFETVTLTREYEVLTGKEKKQHQFMGPRTWNDALELASANASEVRKKTKQFKDSAKAYATHIQKEGTGHHVLDSAVAGASGHGAAPMTDELIESLNADAEEQNFIPTPDEV